MDMKGYLKTLGYGGYAPMGMGQSLPDENGHMKNEESKSKDGKNPKVQVSYEEDKVIVEVLLKDVEDIMDAYV